MPQRIGRADVVDFGSCRSPETDRSSWRKTSSSLFRHNFIGALRISASDKPPATVAEVQVESAPQPREWPSSRKHFGHIFARRPSGVTPSTNRRQSAIAVPHRSQSDGGSGCNRVVVQTKLSRSSINRVPMISSRYWRRNASCRSACPAEPKRAATRPKTGHSPAPSLLPLSVRCAEQSRSSEGNEDPCSPQERMPAVIPPRNVDGEQTGAQERESCSYSG